MKIEQIIRMTPHIGKDGKVELLGFRADNAFAFRNWGVPCTDAPIDVHVTVDVDVHSMSVSATNAFGSETQKVRAEAQIVIEQLQEEKQRFLAVESQ